MQKRKRAFSYTPILVMFVAAALIGCTAVQDEDALENPLNSPNNRLNHKHRQKT